MGREHARPQPPAGGTGGGRGASPAGPGRGHRPPNQAGQGPSWAPRTTPSPFQIPAPHWTQMGRTVASGQYRRPWPLWSCSWSTHRGPSCDCRSNAVLAGSEGGRPRSNGAAASCVPTSDFGFGFGLAVREAGSCHLLTRPDARIKTPSVSHFLA
jgi:hypothetical protein